MVASPLKWDRYRQGQERTEGHQKGAQEVRFGGRLGRESLLRLRPATTPFCARSKRTTSLPGRQPNGTQPANFYASQWLLPASSGQPRAGGNAAALAGDCSPFALCAHGRAPGPQKLPARGGASLAQIPPAGEPGKGMKPVCSEWFSRLRREVQETVRPQTSKWQVSSVCSQRDAAAPAHVRLGVVCECVKKPQNIC